MSETVSIAGRAKWLAGKALQDLMAILNEGDETSRIAGGAVRNSLLGEAVNDIDIATTMVPADVTARCEAAGLRTIPTGVEHGTITVVADERVFEVTTLRADVATDGRRAVVRFGRDWKADAERRDFTINALYADADGTVHDFVGGLADIESRTVRFIGDAGSRIREDYLRILRFFRFFARYGSGRPDAAGLKACARHKDGMARLSAERVWAELSKILGAADPSRSLLWMRQTGVLTAVLPESEKWGIDLIGRLVAAEMLMGWRADPLLRLEAIVVPDSKRIEEMAQRLRLSTRERGRLADWAGTQAITAPISEKNLQMRLYRDGAQAVVDRLRLAYAASMPADGNGAGSPELADMLSFADGWKRPEFPVQGKDLLANGFKPGPAMGDVLDKLEREWLEAGFSLTKSQLITRARELRQS